MTTKRVLSILLLFGLLTSASAQHLFRETKWGISKQEVKALEKLDIAGETEDSIFYYTNILNSDVVLAYSFIEGKLYNAGYMTFKKYTDETEYIDLYDRLRTALIEKYGRPTKEVKTIPDLYKDSIGTGLLIGKVNFVCAWDLEDIRLFLGLQGGNFEISTVVTYTNKELLIIKERRDSRENSEKL